MKNKNETRLISKKNYIYFARTYRHLHFDTVRSVVFVLLFVVPAVWLLWHYYDELTWASCYIAAWLIHAVSGETAKLIESPFLPKMGPAYCLDMPAGVPDYASTFINLAVALVLLWVISTGVRKGRPFYIYLSIVLYIHIISCVYFILGNDLFLYTIADYSELYMKQEIGLWIMFTLLMGILMGALGSGSILWRMMTVTGVMLYAFTFGTIRYALFMIILTEASMLYMPVMFFALGPVFDFMYFVACYAISGNRMIYSLDSKRKGDWVWA